MVHSNWGEVSIGRPRRVVGFFPIVQSIEVSFNAKKAKTEERTGVKVKHDMNVELPDPER